jgi:1-acyl-sn-glycerol-3-phosphate acyltransferase
MVPILVLPFACIHRLFSRNTEYWKLVAAERCLQFLGTKIVRINNVKKLEQAFFLANHRTFADFFIDPLLSESTAISRHAATLSVLPGALMGILDGRFISINRNKSRDEIFGQIEEHMKQNRYYSKRILFFPEGTRKSHMKLDSLEETETYLKPGLLKSIYEFKRMPVQLQITKNKEFVMNERAVKSHYGITVYTSFSEPIYPEDFATFEQFYKQVCLVWFEQFNATMNFFVGNKIYI